MELHLISQIAVYNGSLGAVNDSTSMSSQPRRSINSLSGSEDTVTLSQKGRDKASQAQATFFDQKATTNHNPDGLSQQQLAELQQLKSRDTEVRTHEQAHLSAAGQYARGGASFTYQKGPDGGTYAVGGEVGIDVAKESTPEATITKMQTIKRAALAPANPSGADKRIAAQANIKEAQARQELLQVQQEELLLGESTAQSQVQTQVSSRDRSPELTVSNYGSLKTTIAAYEKMAAN
jgi:hypothetical protein